MMQLWYFQTFKGKNWSAESKSVFVTANYENVIDQADL